MKLICQNILSVFEINEKLNKHVFKIKCYFFLIQINSKIYLKFNLKKLNIIR